LRRLPRERGRTGRGRRRRGCRTPLVGDLDEGREHRRGDQVAPAPFLSGCPPRDWTGGCRPTDRSSSPPQPHPAPQQHPPDQEARGMTTAPVKPRAKSRPADRIFSGATLTAGSLILVALAAVALFLIVQSIPALVADPSELKGDP